MGFFLSPGGSFSLCCARKTQLSPDHSFSTAELVSSSVATLAISALRIKIYRRDADGAFANRFLGRRNRFDPAAGVRRGRG